MGVVERECVCAKDKRLAVHEHGMLGSIQRDAERSPGIMWLRERTSRIRLSDDSG